DKQFHKSLFSLKPYKKITRWHDVTCLKRGDYRMETVTMTSGDPLGFNPKHRVINVSNANILVYPNLVPLGDIPFPTHSWMGYITVRRWIVEDPFLTAGVREYTHGDSMNAINWKATARTGNLQVNKKDFTADPHLMIYLNFDDIEEDIWKPV